MRFSSSLLTGVAALALVAVLAGATMTAQERGAVLRLCRIGTQEKPAAALYLDDRAIELEPLWRDYVRSGVKSVSPMPDWRNPLEFLPHGTHSELGRQLAAHFSRLAPEAQKRLSRALAGTALLPPVPFPAKFLLLAGNYAEHIQEGGGVAAARSETFPHFFWKPPTTAFRGSGVKVELPAVSPEFIDWEVELAFVIGKRCKNVPAPRALEYVAGYTVVNDISNRRFRPNPSRKEQPADRWFDWLHGKWFDGFAPIGPCLASAADIPDPQKLRLQLRVNGQTQQDSNTAKMVFGVAELIEFISDVVTLEPGDVIATGTPAGVGATRNLYLRAGDKVEAEIDRIGTLRTEIVAEPVR
jgi:2-keto-4-pentenoate hydratase/2-oxohepta-3-ene-1,7-dioic acid hydratase in catechol pathway